MKISIFHKFAILGMLFAVFSVNAMAEPVPGYNPSEARDGITAESSHSGWNSKSMQAPI